MSDIDPGLDALRLGDDPPAREGLPPRYRMRADAHYVEQLDSSLLNSPIRFLEVHGLDAPRQDDDESPSAAFVESIRRHGVLQPLLVRSRGGRHLVIAGRKRLAAAAAAGLSRVPCLIERVDDDQASTLAAATNTPATDKPIARVVAPVPAAPTGDLTFAVFADCLTAVASSANLLSPGSTLTQTVAVDLVRAEAARALQLLVAARVLRGDVSVARREVAARSVVERAVEQTAAERRLRGLTVETPSRRISETVSGDEELLTASFGALILGPAVLFETARSKVISLQVNSRADGTVVLSAVHDGAELPHYWRSKLAETEWPDVSMIASSVSSAALVLLRAARRVAELHGGHMTLDCSEGRTSLSIVLPAGRA
jgi:ParB-like chromosome segregation protein Spo0J